MTTALDVITDAFNNINENESEAPIEAVDSQLALRELNRMMASLLIDVGWTSAATVSSTLTIKPDAEDYVVKALAKRLAGHYEIPVSASLAEGFRDARNDLFARYVKIEASEYYPTLPSWNHREYTSSNADTNGVTSSRKVTSVTSNYTALLTDDVISVDCTNGPVTISLPTASSSDGYGFEIIKVDLTSNQVIIDPNGSELVFGDTTYRFNGSQESHEVVSDGAQWS